MLGINGAHNLWYVKGITNMRYGKYRLFEEVREAGGNPYNGDFYCFLSKDRQMMKIIRYKNHKRYLYDITYDPGYKFMQPVAGDKTLHELDFKYFVALQECPVVKQIKI